MILLSFVSSMLLADTFTNPLPASVKSIDNGGVKQAIDAYKDGIGAELIDKPGIATDNSAMNILALKYGEAAKINNTTVLDQVINGNSNPTSGDLALAGKLGLDGAACNDGNVNTTGETYLNGVCQGGISNSLVNFSDNNKLGLTTDQLTLLATYLGVTTPTTFNSIYDSSINAKSGTEFHNRTNNNSHVVALIKTTTGEIIGGYTGDMYFIGGNSWVVYTSGTAPKLFNLTRNIVTTSFIYPQYALLNYDTYGPAFGGGHDLYIIGTMTYGNVSKHSYNTNTGRNLLGSTSSTSFYISSMIVYDIVGR